jgi:DNA-binding response OmpR family regulator
MDAKQANVLIVDDDETNIITVGRVVKRAGYNTLEATSGELALEIVQETPVDLVLLDVMMPGMDGFDTCQAIKALPHGEHIAVIFLTALTDTESLVKGFEVGGADYIVKPFLRAELLAKTKNHVALNLLRKMQATFIRDMESTNLDLQNKAVHLESLSDMLPEILLKQLIHVEHVCLHLSDDLKDMPRQRDKLSEALNHIEQMKVTMEALYVLTANATS